MILVNLTGHCQEKNDILLSKYPPAKPGALRLLAPQRGLIAIGQKIKFENHSWLGFSFRMLSFLRNQECRILGVNCEPMSAKDDVFLPDRILSLRIDSSSLPELSNSESPPAKPGVYLKEIMEQAPKQKEENVIIGTAIAFLVLSVVLYCWLWK